jgi:hypothetical protein
MRSFLANNNLIAVSAGARESALNTAQTLNTAMLFSLSSMFNREPRTEDNAEEANGKEEADTIYSLGFTSSGTLETDKAQVQHLAFLYAYALGTVVTSAWGSGYEHVMTPIVDNFAHPSFTAAQRLGKTVMKQRFYSQFVESVKTTFAKDSWVKASGATLGTGRVDASLVEETVSAAYNATSLILSANGVAGSTAAERLNSIHAVRALNPTTGEYTDVTVTAVSSATPAVLTITAPGAVVTSTSYKILYAPTEAAWATFPSRVVEPPLRVTDLVVNIGGKWNGSAILGGRSMSSEIESVEHNISNNMKVEFRADGSAGAGAYANSVYREGRVQTLSLDRQFRDYIIQKKLDDLETFTVSLKATGSAFETGKNYYAWLIFPCCSALKAPLKVNGKLLGETGDIKILQDDTYGSVIAKFGNKVAAYAA